MQFLEELMEHQNLLLMVNNIYKNILIIIFIIDFLMHAIESNWDLEKWKQLLDPLLHNF